MGIHMKKKVLVKGPALSSSGYGEHARLILRALHANEKHFEIFLENINWGQTGFIIDDSEERKWMEFLLGKTHSYRQAGGQFDVSLQVTIPPEWQRLAPVNIGVTAGIETTKIAPGWIQKCGEVNKIIVPSSHAKYAFDNTSYKSKNPDTNEEVEFRNTTPIEVIHYPVKNTSPTTLDLNLDYDFNFLSVAQWGPRKNLGKTVEWFMAEFKDEEVGLVIKASHAKNNIIDRRQCVERLDSFLKHHPDRKCKIYLLHGNMTEEEMIGLYTHSQIKALVSTTHGEGFGLPLFEAAYSELPIIAPNWSGHTDFLYAPKKDKKGNIKTKAYFSKVDYTIAPIQAEAVWEGVLEKDSQWCFPKESSFRNAMREMYKNYGVRKSEAKKLAKYVKQTFTQEKAYKAIAKIASPGLADEVVIPPAPIGGISFCIPTNGARIKKTNLTLKSIRNQKWKDVPYEIVVCGKVDELEESSDLKLVDKKFEASTGKVAALRNGAVENTIYDTIVFCDDDILLDPDWIEKTLEFSEKKGWKVLGNRMLNPDGTRHWDRSILVPRVLVGYEHPNSDKNLMQTSGFFMIRRDVSESVKWDESKIVYADRQQTGIPEDVQYTLDLHKKNIPFSFNEEALVWHNDDRYTEFGGGTLLKEKITEINGIEFFPSPCEEYVKFLEEV